MDCRRRLTPRRGRLAHADSTPDAERFLPFGDTILSLMSMLRPSRRKRVRVRVEGKLEMNMPKYLDFRMKPEKVKRLFEELDRFARKLEQAVRKHRLRQYQKTAPAFAATIPNLWQRNSRRPRAQR
jgi:hypothetical protein